MVDEPKEGKVAEWLLECLGYFWECYDSYSEDEAFEGIEDFEEEFDDLYEELYENKDKINESTVAANIQAGQIETDDDGTGGYHVTIDGENITTILLGESELELEENLNLYDYMLGNEDEYGMDLFKVIDRLGKTEIEKIQSTPSNNR